MAGRPTMLEFWYRQSPNLMAASDYRDFLLTPGIIGEEDPPTTLSGMINLKTRRQGQADLPSGDSAAERERDGAHVAADWKPLFRGGGTGPVKTATAQPGMDFAGSR